MLAMVRIVSLNLNGIRSAWGKDVYAWLKSSRSHIVCVQEIKAQEADLTDEMRRPRPFYGHYHHAEKKGYSGVGVLSRTQPDGVTMGVGIAEIDAEGRYLEARFGNLSVISIYLPSGSSSEERLQVKFNFMTRFLPVLERLRASGREVVICGDWNIAHKELDLKNWRSNQKNPGFLPEERAWLTDVLDRVGMVDVFRRLNTEPDQYTWWSNRGQAWDKNVGWRIDYQIATPGIAALAKRASIYKAQRFSDHAPLLIDYAIDLT